MKAIIAYVPVIHAGYLKFFRQYQGWNLYLLAGKLLAELPQLTRDVRACLPTDICVLVRNCNLFPFLTVISDRSSLQSVAAGCDEIVMPDEDVSHAIADKYLSNQPVQFVPSYLRWDKKFALSEVAPSPNRLVSVEEFDREFMDTAFREAQKSSDWWRQVGAVLVDDGRVLLSAFNHHLPTERSPYIDGDPRFNFNAGERIDLSTAIHAEAAIISRAALRGISTEGKSLYVSTFPCPGCAYLIAEAGIKRVYYAEGYSLVNAETVLHATGVEIVKVVLNHKGS